MKAIPSFFFSFDFELGWGVIENGRWVERERAGIYRRLRRRLPQVLAALESTGISADWAVVGAMCSAPETLRVDHLPPSYAEKVNRFVELAEPETVDGRDLVSLLAATPSQRLISHGYSHLVLTRPDVTPETLVAEVRLAEAVVATLNGDGDVFVFPENRLPSSELRCRLPLTAYRSPPNFSHSSAPVVLQKIMRPPEAVRALDSNGMTKTSGSALFKPRSGSRSNAALFSLQNSAIISRLRAGISQCIWCHPFNFEEFPGLYEDFENFLGRIAVMRDRGELRIAQL